MLAHMDKLVFQIMLQSLAHEDDIANRYSPDALLATDP